MSLIIPEARFEAPELFEPQKKPVGQVVVNMDHPIGKHLKIAILPGGGVVRDIVSRAVATPSGNAIINSRQNAEYDGTGDKHQFGFVTPVFSEITVMAMVNRDASGTDNDMGIYSDQYLSNFITNGVSLNLRQTSSGFLFAAGAAYSFVDDTSVGINNWINICGTFNGGEPLLYLNGVLKPRGGGTSAASYSASTGGNARIGTYYDEASNRTMDGEIEYVYVFDKALNFGQINQVIRHPYGSGEYPMLIPA